jgi:hypothetical protein
MTFEKIAIGAEERNNMIFLGRDSLLRYAIRHPRAISAINDLIPEHGSSTTRYECAVLIILPSRTAAIPIAFTAITDNCDAKIFKRKLIFEIATKGRGIMNMRNRIGKRSFLRNCMPRNKSTRPIIMGINANPELKYTCQNALMIWIRIPEIKKIQPIFFAGKGVIAANSLRFNHTRKAEITGINIPWL